MAEYHYSMTVSSGNYNIRCTELSEGYTGSVGNLTCKYTETNVTLTDRAYRNWLPILDAPATNIEVTDADAGYDEDVLTLSDLVTYFTTILHIPEGEGGGEGGGGSDSVVWGSITGTLADQTDIKNALDAKQDSLTFDNSPTSGSNNPVKSGGVFTALAGKADASTVRFVIHAEYNVGTGAVTLASSTTQAELMSALTAKKAMDIDFTVSGTYFRSPMLSFYEDGTGGHIVKFRNEGIGIDVVLTADTTGNTYSFDTEAINWVGTQAQYDAITTKDPNRIYYITASNS